MYKVLGLFSHSLLFAVDTGVSCRELSKIKCEYFITPLYSILRETNKSEVFR